MSSLQAQKFESVDDAHAGLQTALSLEFATLPPYLYTKFSIPPGANPAAAAILGDIVGQEMIHLCLACNIMNALGGNPVLTSPLTYPSTLPGNIGPPGGDPIVAHLWKFSPEAMAQGMAIESPENPIVFPPATLTAAEAETERIGQFYARLDAFLATLPASDWTAGINQITDAQFFPGQLYAVNDYADAHRAITQIVSEGEGSADTPLDFENEVSHYYRFREVHDNLVLTKTATPPGYQWGPAQLGVDWTAVYPAIDDPSTYNFSGEPPAAQAAQAACNLAYSQLIDALQLAVTGQPGQLGAAVRAMFDLRKTAMVALNTPLSDGTSVAGPAFLYTPTSAGASS